MPPRKKNVVAQEGSDGEQQVEASMDHVSMHIEVTESSEEVKQPSNRDLVPFYLRLERRRVLLTLKRDLLILRRWLGNPILANYTSLIFTKSGGMIGNAREHIMRYMDALTAHSYDYELRLREFSKSLEGRAFTWYTILFLGSVLSWNDMATSLMKKFFALDAKLTLSDLQ
nr:hypothetical protein CFP56_17150 [Quercus suber]